MMVVYLFQNRFNKFSKSDIDEFKDLNYQELAKKIIYPFIGNFMNENDLSKIIDKSYSVFRKKNVVDLVKSWRSICT